MWLFGTGSRRRLLGLAFGTLVGIALVAGAYGFLFGFGPDPGTCACSPPAGFEAETNGNGTVTVTHQGGEWVKAGTLVVTVGDDERTWAAVAGLNATDEVGTGDSVTVRASSGETVRVVWLDGDTVRTTLLEYTVDG